MSATRPPGPVTPGQRVRERALELRDRARVSDPGLGRLRTALSAAVCVGTALPVQLGIGAMLGYSSTVGFAATVFGAVVAMLGSQALVGSDRRVKIRTAVFFPLAVAAGLVPATLTGGRQLFQVIGFAVILFLSVWVRRFGTPWFFYGFMAWMGFFFATFLHVTWPLVPELLVAAVVSTGWVLLLTTTILRANQRRVLHSTLAAFFASGRAVARECADLLEVPEGSVRAHRRALRSLGARRTSLSNTSLLAEAWSAEHGALPDGWSTSALRRRLIETQQAVERIAGAATALHGAAPDLVGEARRTLDHLARRRDVAAAAAAERLDHFARRAREQDLPGWWPARHLSFGVREFLRFDAAVDEPPEVDPGEEDFEAATGLVSGGLSGAPAVARDVAPRGRWNPVSRVSMNTRQGVQVMLAGILALVLGTALSPTRYYWAVIAVFVTFAGTGTRSETLRKGSARVAGTLLGLVAAIALADLTVGHRVWIFTAILGCIFWAFYLVKVSYAGMTFFITVLLGQLYTVLGMFSDSLLALRLGETVIGAAAGVVVALLFAPLSTRDTVRSARDELFGAIEALLEGAAAYAAGERVVLDALVRALDDRARGLVLVARPLTRPLVLGSSSRSTRRWLGLLVAAVSQCRSLALALQRRPGVAADDVGEACRALGRAVRELASAEPGAPTPGAAEPLLRGDHALFSGAGAAYDDEPVVRHLHHLGATLSELAEADGVVGSTPLAPGIRS